VGAPSHLVLALLSSLATVEAQKISERTKAGLERARRRGAKISRPQLEEGLRSEITHRLADGATPFAVVWALGIDRKTVRTPRRIFAFFAAFVQCICRVRAGRRGQVTGLLSGHAAPPSHANRPKSCCFAARCTNSR
jgi:hypothetical protein